MSNNSEEKRTLSAGDLIHADKHGFMAIPENEQPNLLEAANFSKHGEW